MSVLTIKEEVWLLKVVLLTYYNFSPQHCACVKKDLTLGAIVEVSLHFLSVRPPSLNSSKWNLLYICGHEDHNILSNTRCYLPNHTFKCKRFLKMPGSTCKATNAGYYPMYIESSSKTNLLSNIKLLLCHRDCRLKRTFFSLHLVCRQTERYKKSSRQWRRLHYDQPDFPSTSLEPTVHEIMHRLPYTFWCIHFATDRKQCHHAWNMHKIMSFSMWKMTT